MNPSRGGGDASVPNAPWALLGECIVAAVRRPRPAPSLPAGVGRLPGPALVAALRYTDSPVGPFLELVVAEPARLRLRPGFCVTTSVVSASPARVGGRLGWGFPRELGRLSWSADGDDSVLLWGDRSLRVASVGGRGMSFPVYLPLHALQRRTDGPVVVPARIRGRGRVESVLISVPDDDPLAWLNGRHPGLSVHAARLLLRPARRPTGLVSTLRAPLWAAEPAMTGIPNGPLAEGGVAVAVAHGHAGGARRYSAPSPRALSSVG